MSIGNIGQIRIEPTNSGSIRVTNQAIQNVTSARALHSILRNNHLGRILLYAEIDGMISGNPPYNVQDLSEAGLSHVANFNTLEPRSLYEKACLAYWNLLFTSESIININIRDKDPGAKEAAQIMSQHWNDVVRTEWPSFDTNVAVFQSQLVKFGLSPVMWPDERDPTWRVVELDKFLIPDQSSSDQGLLNTICVETEFSMVYLLELYNRYKDNREGTDWNIDEVEWLLLMTANQIENGGLNDAPLINMMDLERKISGGDINYGQLYNETLRLITLLYKEGDGKITRFIFHKVLSKGTGKTPGFLYVKNKQYKSFAEALLLFTQSPGEAFIHSNIGVGHKIYPLSQSKMMLDNSLLDGGRWASTLLLKSSSMTIKDNENLRFYPGTPCNIGAADFIQNNLGANLEGIIATSQYFSSILDKNAANAGDDPSRPDSSIGSLAPSQSRLQAFKEYGVLRNQVNHFYSTFDRLLHQMTVKMVNSNKAYPNSELFIEWKERCIDDGVPDQLFVVEKAGRLPPRWEVKATRSAGAGSQVALLMALQEFAPLVGTLAREGQLAYTKESIKGIFGSEYIPMFTKGLEESDELGAGGSLAQVENNDLQNGQACLVEPANDHRTHITIHLALAEQIIKALNQQQTDAIEANKVFTVLVPHLQEHLQAIANSIYQQEFLKSIKGSVGQVIKYAELNKRNAIKQLQSQQQQQQADAENTEKVMSDEQRKDFVAQKDQARKDADHQAKLQNVADSTEQRGKILEKKTDAEVESLRKKTDAEVQSKQVAASAKSQLDTILNTGSTPSPTDFS